MEIIFKGDIMGHVTQFPDFQGKVIRSARWYIGIGWIFAITALFFLPLLFGILGIIMGVIANRKGHRGGTIVIVANILMMVIGVLTGAILSTFLKMFLSVFFILNV